MLKEITFQNNKIVYSITGKGLPLMLLHGYLMSSQIWKDFKELLAMKYRVIALDLPGHGSSGSFPPVHSMELMAEAAEAVLENENIEKCNIIGHSMGGYVGLAFLEHYPNRIEKIMLLNTHPFEDTDRKIAIRNKIISLLKKAKKELLLGQMLSEMISPSDEEKYKDIRESALDIVSIQSVKSLISTTNGMKLRPDRSLLLREPAVSLKWILSESDQQLNAEELVERARAMSILEPQIIEGGHMSFLENPYGIFLIVHNFFNETI